VNWIDSRLSSLVIPLSLYRWSDIAVLLDISASLSNIIPGIQASIDNMLLYQETIQPEKDLRFMIESYRTGGFAPKVLVYENYYNSAEGKTALYPC
jgi:hypothetical protein